MARDRPRLSYVACHNCYYAHYDHPDDGKCLFAPGYWYHPLSTWAEITQLILDNQSATPAELEELLAQPK